MKLPTHLQKSTRHWISSVSETYEQEPHHLRLLTLATEAWDLYKQARIQHKRAIERDTQFFM